MFWVIIEMVLLSTHNICFSLGLRNLFFLGNAFFTKVLDRYTVCKGYQQMTKLSLACKEFNILAERLFTVMIGSR